MDAAVVVVYEVPRHHIGVVLCLLTEIVGQAGEARLPMRIVKLGRSTCDVLT